jgi:hypothetical protein
MKFTNLFFFLSLSIFLSAQEAITQDVIPRNKIKPRLQLSIEPLGDLLVYRFELTNDRSAEQPLWQFRLYLSSHLKITNQTGPQGWESSYLNEKGVLMVFWGSPAQSDIIPGGSLRDFSITARSIPGIVQYYAEGYAPLPQGEADSIPGYDDLTPYGPGIVGKTVGPVLPPEPFVPMTFLDTLVSYKHQAAALGWVGQEGFVKQLDEKLDQSRDQLSKGHIKQARDKIEEFVKKLENEAKKTEKDQDKKNDKKWVTSEGYALLKFNAEYLIEKLDEQITKKK